MQPFEIITAPYSIYVAPLGTAFPVIDAAPAVAWVLLGLNGTRSEDPAGVTVTLGRTEQTWTSGGGTLPMKAWTTDESIRVGTSLADTTVETVAQILDSATITTVAAGSSNAGHKSIPLARGISIKEFAVLARGTGLSPYGEAFNAQYEFTRCFVSGDQAPVYSKANPTMVAFEYTVLDGLASISAVYRAQTAAQT